MLLQIIGFMEPFGYIFAWCLFSRKKTERKESARLRPHVLVGSEIARMHPTPHHLHIARSSITWTSVLVCWRGDCHIFFLDGLRGFFDASKRKYETRCGKLTNRVAVDESSHALSLLVQNSNHTKLNTHVSSAKVMHAVLEPRAYFIITWTCLGCNCILLLYLHVACAVGPTMPTQRTPALWTAAGRGPRAPHHLVLVCRAHTLFLPLGPLTSL